MFFQYKMRYLVVSHYSCEDGNEKSASLVMQTGDPQNRFLNPTLTLMMDSYNAKDTFYARFDIFQRTALYNVYP